ncbi:MAG TPA: aerial mycelium formation protein [Actinomycetota bacterium]|nr:aerial mycelium formation protein [Actinomycetota bacterium]
MSEKQQRREDRILDPAILADVESVPTAELRNRRDACRELEAEFSYARRLLQGKIDILEAELKRRSEGGEAEMGDLVSRLPSILADEPRSGGATRLLESDLPRNAGKFRRQTERLATGLAHIESSTPEELAAMVEELAAEERKVSGNRRKAQQIIDGLNAELVRRYRKGDEDPSALLSS